MYVDFLFKSSPKPILDFKIFFFDKLNLIFFYFCEVHFDFSIEILQVVRREITSNFPNFAIFVSPAVTSRPRPQYIQLEMILTLINEG